MGDISGSNIPFQTVPDFILINPAGGPTGDMIIGDTAVGGMIADSALPLLGPLFALTSDTAIIGNAAGSIGAVNIDDFFFDFDPNNGGNGLWRISGDLVVGHAGQGFLDFLNAGSSGLGGSMGVGGRTYIGGGDATSPGAAPGLSSDDPFLGQGTVRINGLGSNLTTQDDLFVGHEGVGFVEVSGRASLVSITEAFVGGSAGISTGDGTVTLTDLGTRWTAADAVTIGGVAGDSRGRVEISNQALFQIEEANGLLTVNPLGQIDLAGGTLRNLSSTPIANAGLIRGDGFIDADLEIAGAGELRNAAATANEREYLLFSGTVTNMGGYIESFGGEMEFLDTVTNALGGEMVARDAIIRVVSGGLVNDGDLILGGDTIVHGAISGAGILTVLSNSIVTVVGDITFTESLLVAALNEGEVAAFLEPPSSNAINITVGNTPGTLDVIGDVMFGSSTVLDLDFSSSVSSQPGDSFQVVSAGNIIGTFANDRVVTDGRYWDISYVGDEVFVTASADLFSPSSGDFNGDGVVSGLDFLSWQRGYGSGYNATDLANWEAGYGGSPPVAAATAVPEPSALLLALSALAFGYRRRVA